MDYEAMDKVAGRMTDAAIRSEKENFTLLEACKAAGLDCPLTYSQLQGAYRVLDHWGIKHNMVGSKDWKATIDECKI